MTTVPTMIAKFNQRVQRYGQSVSITNYPDVTYDDDSYDEEQLIGASGTTATVSGLLSPVDVKDITSYQGMQAQYTEQGQLSFNDAKVYLPGDTSITHKSTVTIAGSPYDIVPNGIMPSTQPAGSIVYIKAFIRLRTGSEFLS